MTMKTIMCGLGEEPEEILAVMDDLGQVECDVLTLSQYLNPTKSMHRGPFLHTRGI